MYVWVSLLYRVLSHAVEAVTGRRAVGLWLTALCNRHSVHMLLPLAYHAKVLQHCTKRWALANWRAQIYYGVGHLGNHHLRFSDYRRVGQVLYIFANSYVITLRWHSQLSCPLLRELWSRRRKGSSSSRHIAHSPVQKKKVVWRTFVEWRARHPTMVIFYHGKDDYVETSQSDAQLFLRLNVTSVVCLELNRLSSPACLL